MKLSLTSHTHSDAIIAWSEQASITHAQFLADVMHIVECLPNKKYAINLCVNRYHFMVVFAAVIVKGQTNLLPQNQVSENLFTIVADYKDSYCINEELIEGLEIEQLDINVIYKKKNSFLKSADKIKTPVIAATFIAAIAFTSGSTGKPKANTKTWGTLVVGAQMAAKRFCLDANPSYIVSTVPSQHMYGLETSILYSLQNRCPIYDGRPFYPEDIRCAVKSAPQAVILITTPVHLRACVSSQNLQWDNLNFIISATAPLRIGMAEQVKKKMKSTLKEIFGCTEIGAIASRETLKDHTWHLYEGIRIYKHLDKNYIHAPHLIEDFILTDRIEIENEKYFKLLGRHEDMVNIGGKRGSLADLKIKLESIDGVSDAVVYLPDEDNEAARLTAFVIAEGLTTKQVLVELAKKVDSIFIPRPIYKVQSLPYSETGKLTQQALKYLSSQCRKK